MNPPGVVGAMCLLRHGISLIETYFYHTKNIFDKSMRRMQNILGIYTMSNQRAIIKLQVVKWTRNRLELSLGDFATRMRGAENMAQAQEAGEKAMTMGQAKHLSAHIDTKNESRNILLLPQFNTCSSSGVSDRLLVKKSFDLLRLFLNASHMGFGMFFKLPIPFCRRSFGKGRFQIPVQ